MGYNTRQMERRLTVEPEPADSPDASAMVEELETHLASRYPSESRHGFTVERLVATGVLFFVARSGGAAAGCGGILFVDDPGEAYAEIKRMYVRPAYRGRGIGRRVLDRLFDEARRRGVTVLRLETGVDQVEAIALYEKVGFRRSPPFGPYRDDPLSPCFELRLEPAGGQGVTVPRSDLARFVEAQEPVYPAVLAELRQGRKASHWMWFVFPQLDGLGHSAMARAYAIGSLVEARAYLADPVLGARLRECAGLVLVADAPTAETIFGPIDAMKLRSSMTLFHRADPGDPVFTAVLERYFGGHPDPRTERLLQVRSRSSISQA